MKKNYGLLLGFAAGACFLSAAAMAQNVTPVEAARKSCCVKMGLIWQPATDGSGNGTCSKDNMPDSHLAPEVMDEFMKCVKDSNAH